MAKFKKALVALSQAPIVAAAKIVHGNSLKLLNCSEYADLKADLIFLDPPYGDSVPYTEFSNIWNSFLKDIPCSDEDISVSDRINKSASWENYSQKLDEYMCCFTQHLTATGKLLITFNNNDMRAWTALIAALQKNGFVCESVFYQIPAVISSKAQMSINSSYISDVYSVYTLNTEVKVSNDLSPVVSHLCFVANSREGKISKTILDREFIIAWLKNNMDYWMLADKDSIVSSIFDYDKKSGVYTIKDIYKKKTKLLKDAVVESMNKILETGTFSLLDCYLKASEMPHIKAMKEAMDLDGVEVLGYLGWGLIDILSSHGDMEKRYGVVYVNRGNHDLRDMKRVPKKSYYWLKQVIASNGEIL